MALSNSPFRKVFRVHSFTLTHNIKNLQKAKHSQFQPVESEFGITHNWNEEHPDPNQKRWMPFKLGMK